MSRCAGPLRNYHADATKRRRPQRVSVIVPWPDVGGVAADQVLDDIVADRLTGRHNRSAAATSNAGVGRPARSTSTIWGMTSTSSFLDVPPAVDIREVGLRDGLQLEDPLPWEDKQAMIAALAVTGVRRIEATAFVSPRAVPAMADAERVAVELHRWPDVSWSALVA